jgi:hypothetical protein
MVSTCAATVHGGLSKVLPMDRVIEDPLRFADNHRAVVLFWEL